MANRRKKNEKKKKLICYVWTHPLQAPRRYYLSMWHNVETAASKWCNLIIAIETDGSSEDYSPWKSDFRSTSEKNFIENSLRVIFHSEEKKTSEKHTWKCAAGWNHDTAAFAEIQRRLCLGKYPDISEVLLGAKKKQQISTLELRHGKQLRWATVVEALFNKSWRSHLRAKLYSRMENNQSQRKKCPPATAMQWWEPICDVQAGSGKLETRINRPQKATTRLHNDREVDTIPGPCQNSASASLEVRIKRVVTS